MNYLCVYSESKTKSDGKPKIPDSGTRSKSNNQSSVKTVSSLTVCEALQSEVDGNSILPTFSCELNGVLLRALKDGGCQSNFISERLADAHELKVINDNVRDNIISTLPMKSGHTIDLPIYA